MPAEFTDSAEKTGATRGTPRTSGTQTIRGVMEGFINEITSERTVLTGWLRPDPDNSSPIVLRIGNLHSGVTTLAPPSEALRALKGDSVATFALALDHPLQLGALADGSVGIRYEENHPGTEVVPTERLRSLEVAALSEWAVGLDSQLKKELLTALGSASTPAGAHPPQDSYQASYIEFPVGLEAANGSVQLGQDGYLFPVGGSNSILRRFQADDGTPEHSTQMREVKKWQELIRARETSSQSVGARFRQIILPDKITALPQLAPVALNTPTRAYSALHARLSETSAYVDTFSLFRKWSESHSPWLRADAHFSAKAAQKVAVELLVSLSLEVPDLLATPLDSLVAREGDLGKRFFGVPILDHRAEPAIDRMPLGMAPLTELVRKPIEGRNKVSRWMGAHQVSRSGTAPIDASLMIFGTSSTNLGTVPNQLSWWLSRIFREYTRGMAPGDRVRSRREVRRGHHRGANRGAVSLSHPGRRTSRWEVDHP